MSKLIFIKKNSYLLVLFGAVLAVAPARAAIVTLTFTGTYDNLIFMGVSTFAGWPTSGLTSIPFSYSLTYDTSLNDPNASVVTAGSTLANGTDTAAHDMYGYMSAGLLSLNMTLGNLSWNVGDLGSLQNAPFAGAVGDLWFDTDISQAAPTRAWIGFHSSYSNRLGSGSISSGSVFFDNVADINRAGRFSYESAETTSPFTITSSVPEPSALSLLVVGLGVVLRRRRRTV